MEHIHKEIHGTKGKCAIAHRDIKSKNILIKTNGECVIGDLGLAIRYDPVEDELDPPDYNCDKVRVGTKRYMPPEILSNSLDTSIFYNYCRADIYSMGLVYWEIMQRTRLTDDYVCDEYQLPYALHVQSDPSIEEMKMIVVDKGMRPQFDSRIGMFTFYCELCNNRSGRIGSRGVCMNTTASGLIRYIIETTPVMGELISLTEECWMEEPNARLPALRIKKSLGSLLQLKYNITN